MRRFNPCWIVLALLLSAATAAADEVTLIELGRFDRLGELASGFGVETHRVQWDQRAVESLVDVNTLPGICSANQPLSNECVHSIQIELTTTRPYSLFLVYQRAGSEVDEILFDDNKIGALSVGSFEIEEGDFAEVSFALGKITPRKTHTITIRSPDHPPGDGFHFVTGIKVVGLPVSDSSWRLFRSAYCRGER